MIKLLKKIPAPPDYMTDGAKGHWLRILPDLVKQGQVSSVDVTVLSMACEIFAAWQNAQSIEDRAKLSKNYVSIMEKFGVTSRGRKVLSMPVSRKRSSGEAELRKEFSE